MLRKTSALVFMLVMTLLITLKHPVFGYCMCLDSFFAGSSDCTCKLIGKSAPQKEKKTSSTDCCASCDKVSTSPDSPEKTTPCRDCMPVLSVEVGDFLWDSTVSIPNDAETYAAPPFYLSPESPLPSLASSDTPASIRGNPPPDHLPLGLPFYLRHSVLRL